MFPWIRKRVATLSTADVEYLKSESSYIYKNIDNINLKTSWCKRIENLLEKFSFLRADIQNAYQEILDSDLNLLLPMSTIGYLKSYFLQFLQCASIQPETKIIQHKEIIQEKPDVVANDVWYVLIHGRYGYVLGKLKEDYSTRFVVDIYKDGKLLKESWSIAKTDKRTIATFNRSISEEEQTDLVAKSVSSWMENLMNEGRKLKKKLKKRIFLANSYNYGVQPCAVISEDSENYHLAIYENGVCVNPDWVIDRSNKRQILRKDI